jgi:hypothetical protein
MYATVATSLRKNFGITKRDTRQCISAALTDAMLLNDPALFIDAEANRSSVNSN